MLITDAVTKWCPFTRIGIRIGQVGVTINRDNVYTVLQGTNCIGPHCAVWISNGEKHGQCGLVQGYMA